MKPKSSQLYINRLIMTSIHTVAILLSSYLISQAGDGIKWNRIRLVPSLTATQEYTDNVYLEEKDKSEDYILTVSPELTLDVAILPKNYFSLKYRGSFKNSEDAENFNEENHFGSLSFNSEASKGSKFVAGISTADTSIQPFSINERSKDYTLDSAFATLSFKFGSVTDIGGGYTYEDREFDHLEFSDDDFTRASINLYIVYEKSPILPLLIEYRHVDQDNNDMETRISDFQSHTFFFGARWRPVRKLSGSLRFGYLIAEFDESNVDNYNGYAVDTDLSYALSEITQFTLSVVRDIQQPTKSAKETGDYYVSTGAGLTVTHRKWDKITTRLKLLYRDRDYKEIQTTGSVREDHYYRAGLSIEYSLRNWILLSVNYTFQENDSNIQGED